MIPLFTLLISALQALVTSANWRKGLLFVLLIGVLQDPFRKLAPGIPAYYMLWAAALFGVVFFLAWSQRSLGRMGYLALGDRRLAFYGRLLLLLLLLHAVHAFLRWGSPVIPVLGMVFYMAPVIGLWVGMAYARSEVDIRRFLWFYALLYTMAVFTVYLSPDYKDIYPVLQEIGSFEGRELRIYDMGTVMYSYSGIFRVGETAAWHAATAAIFWIILAMRSPSLAFRILVAVLVVALVGAIFLTGRRKMLMSLSLFIVLFSAILIFMRGGGGKVVVMMVILGVIGSFGLQLLEKDQHSSLYMQRGATVFSGVEERVGTSIKLFYSAINRAQGVGLGVGVASQGGRYAGGGRPSVGGAGEAGIGQIVLEIGLLGLLLLVLLLWRLARRTWHLLLTLGNKNPSLQIYGAAFSAFILANVATYAVATQLYGDPFVLLMIGLTAGMLFRVLWESIRLYGERAVYANSPNPYAIRGVPAA